MEIKKRQPGGVGRSAQFFKEQLLQAVLQTLEEVLPGRMISAAVQRNGEELRIGASTYQLNRYDKLWLVGSGKASLAMARQVCEILPDRIAGGCIITNYRDKPLPCAVKTHVGSHPVPTKKSLAAAAALTSCLAEMSGSDLYMYLLSGGSSALLEQPVSPLPLSDMQQVTKLLLRCGAPIEEINIVRKHLSLVKGGRLGRLSKAQGIVLVISDVIGDDLATIGSAPLFCDSSTYQDACNVLVRYGAWQKAPAGVRQVLQQGLDGILPETPKQPQPNINHIMVGNNFAVLQQLKRQIKDRGIPAHIMTSVMQGEAREVARTIVAIGREIAASGNPFAPPVCLLFGGETTVTVKGSGRGGRNQEMALAALREIRDDERLAFISLGTDGIDGPTDAAGAMANRDIFQAACDRGLNMQEYLDNNNAYGFFQNAGGLITTGPTGTNLMDITAMLVA
ncbi:MAG: DUF4147 domain-containing protein [Deltaproteobacteria bacterium]|nr:DUF4147 domain-containing protein [Deltaproteobacteria bacterium]